jgi:hypothetical protein
MRKQRGRFITPFAGLLLGCILAALSKPGDVSAGDCLAKHKCVVHPGGEDTADTCEPTWQSDRTCRMGIEICTAGCTVIK